MATIDECRAALDQLAARLAGLGTEARERHSADRTVSLDVTDLGCCFRGRLADGELIDMELDDDGGGKAQLRLRCSSDDLIALTTGDLGVGSAWASGRLKVDASLPDLLRLRSLL